MYRYKKYIKSRKLRIWAYIYRDRELSFFRPEMGSFERLWELQGQNFQNNYKSAPIFHVHIIKDNFIDYFA